MSGRPPSSAPRIGAPAASGATGEATATATDPAGLRLEERRGAVVLLSGGLDSATVLAIAAAQGYDCYGLTIDYGQRHRIELERAADLARYFAVPHRRIRADLAAFGGSALTDDTDVPAAAGDTEIGAEIPATYVPARNTVFLALALAWAETLEVSHVFIGANVVDYSGYPDCRPDFLRAFERVANLGTRAGVEGEVRFRIHAPLLQMSKSEIIVRGANLSVPFHLTHSCYDPNPEGLACGLCESCILRRRGFREAEVEDPTAYAG